MANRYKGEIDLPVAGKKSFIRFDLEDLAALEDEFGRDFFSVIEEAAVAQSPRDLPKCLSIGLKVRKGQDEERIWDGLDKRELLAGGFKIGDAGKPIMDALAQSWLGKSYDDLVKEAEEARQKQMAAAVQQAKEAADAAGAPFDAEASLNALLRLGTGSASPSANSGA